MDDAVPRIQDIPRPVPDAEGTGLDGWTRTRHDVDEIAFSDIGREFHAAENRILAVRQFHKLSGRIVKGHRFDAESRTPAKSHKRRAPISRHRTPAVDKGLEYSETTGDAHVCNILGRQERAEPAVRQRIIRRGVGKEKPR